MLLLALMIALLSAYMVYWGTQKNGFHVDEMYSLMDIRGGGINRPHYEEEFFNKWYVASELESTIGVTEENAFSYDINRPMSPFFNLLHTAYSFYPGLFSIWPSMVLNIIMYIGSLIMIYKLSSFFIDNKYLALLPGLLWGVSSAAINLVVFIRMYAMLTFFCILLTYTLFIAIKNDFGKWWQILAIFAISLAGALTHQYFLVYAFFVTVLVCIYLLCYKKIKQLLKFSLPMLAAVIGYQLFLQKSITSILSGGRGSQAVNSLIAGNATFVSKVDQYLDILSQSVFGGVSIGVVLALAVILMVIIGVAYTRNGVKIFSLMISQKTVLWMIMCGTCLLFLLMIARIAPYRTFRYISCITPFLIILLISLLVSAFKAIGFKSTIIVFTLISIPYTVLLTDNIYDDVIFREGNKVDETLSRYYHLPAVVISQKAWHTAGDYWRFFNFTNEIFFTTSDETDMEIIGDREYKEGLVLVFPGSGREAEGLTVNDVLAASDLNNATFLVQLAYHEVFYLE